MVYRDRKSSGNRMRNASVRIFERKQIEGKPTGVSFWPTSYNSNSTNRRFGKR